ncbi:hypothetical protein HY642_00260 [Candidatus Woesearchaeota archaeon]|nr:hypothetical protein [Candidatus Woesearchaeota archaeon]
MVETYESIVYKEPIVQRISPGRVLYDSGKLCVNSVEIPQRFVTKFLNRCDALGVAQQELERRVNTAVEKKGLQLRGKPTEHGIKWFGMVTDEFQPINIPAIDRAVRQQNCAALKVRYFRGSESVALNYAINVPGFPGMNVAIDTGKYGLWGGDGEHSLKYGLSWFNGMCTNWTVFLHQDLTGQLGRRNRIIHRKGVESLPDRFGQLVEFSRSVKDKVAASASQYWSRGELEAYSALYEGRGLSKRIMQPIIDKAQPRISSYDVAYDLTKLVQDKSIVNSDAVRSRVEYLAGEVILSYDRIKAKLLVPSSN